MRTGTRGSPSWPGLGPKAGYVDADWLGQIAKYCLRTGRAIRFYASPALKYPPAGDVGVPRSVESQVDTVACRRCVRADGRRMPGQSSAADRSVANAPRRPSRGPPQTLNPPGDRGLLSRCQLARRTTAMRTIEQAGNTLAIVA